MASILNSQPVWPNMAQPSAVPQINQPAASNFPQSNPAAGNPLDTANVLIQQILSSPDSNQAFAQMINSSPEAQHVMALINQYGNGDPKAGLINYAASIGQQAMAQKAAQMFGLK